LDDRLPLESVIAIDRNTHQREAEARRAYCDGEISLDAARGMFSRDRQ
jgi:hypothetical protein